MRQSINPLTRTLGPARRLAKRLLGRHRPTGSVLWNRYNLNQLQAVESVLKQNGWSLQNFSSILDFGCGPGRLSQHLSRLAPSAELFGCDVDSKSVAEAQRLCPRGRFHTNDFMPPLAFEDGQFDLVWAWGVFTNIPEAGHRAWLKELARVLRPGGAIVSTTHSHESLRRLEVFSPESLKKYNFPGSIEEFIQSGDGYHYTSPENWPPEYGFAIISKDYVMNRWPEYSGLPLVAYAEAAIETYPEGCQDIVILAKEPVQRHF